MKKRILLALFLFIFLILPKVSAQADPSDVSQVIGEQFNVSADKIPTSMQDIEDIKQEYLQKHWTEFISKNKILGPIHSFFTKISLVFKLLFSHPYEISLTLFGIIVFWILVVTWTARSVEAPGSVPGWAAVLIGVIGASILAWTGLFALITKALLGLILRQENWWIRLIVIILIVGALAFTHTISKLVEKYIKKRKTEKIQDEEKVDVKEIKTIVKKAKER